jgi:rubredoxin
MTLSMELMDIKDGNFVLDLEAAARNRANIERMRKREKEVDKNDLRSWKPVLKPVEIKQEVIKDMQKVVLVSDEELEKQKEAIIADYLNPDMTLAQMLVKWHIQTTRWHDLRIKWNVPSKGKGKHPNNHLSKTKVVKDKTKENIEPKYRCPYCGLGFSQVEALIQHATVCQPLPFRGHDAKPVLPPWNESWGDSVKVAWLEAVTKC